MSASRFDATLIVTFGRHARVRRDDGAEFDARPLGRRLDCVCGDRVLCEYDADHGELHIVAVGPRRNSLARTDARGQGETIVANIDLLVVVAAAAPAPDLFLVDRYLSAAQCAGIDALIVVNKMDLPGSAELCHELESLGGGLAVPVTGVSAHQGLQLRELAAHLQGRIAVLVGQSGVGKSSLLQALLPTLQLRTQTLDRDAEGRHTTTRSEMFQLPGGGAIIDSPGVRDFAPAIDTLEPRALGFADIARLAAGCRFQDCGHLQEPDCTVRAAVDQGVLSARRYESYRRLRRLHNDLLRRRGPRK